MRCRGLRALGWQWCRWCQGPAGGVGVIGDQQGVYRVSGRCRKLWGIMSVGVSGVHWGAGRECRYSGASRGIGGIRGLLEGIRGVRGYWVPSGV